MVFSISFFAFSSFTIKRRIAIVSSDIISLLIGLIIYYLSWQSVVLPSLWTFSKYLANFLSPNSSYINEKLQSIEPVVFSLNALRIIWHQFLNNSIKALKFYSIDNGTDLQSVEWPLGLCILGLASYLIRDIRNKGLKGTAVRTLAGGFTILAILVFSQLLALLSPDRFSVSAPYRVLPSTAGVTTILLIWSALSVLSLLNLRNNRLVAQRAIICVFTITVVGTATHHIYLHSLNAYLEIEFLKSALRQKWSNYGNLSRIHLIRTGSSDVERSFVGRPSIGGEFFSPRTSIPGGSFVAIRFALREIGYKQ